MKYVKGFGLLLLTGLVLYIILYARAKVVQVEYADVYLKDLPQELDGTTILYVSDIHIASEFDIRRTQKLMERLQTTNPDLLLLGGDYSDVRLWRGLRVFGNEEAFDAMKQEAAALSHRWMATLANFHAPMGKFAVQGNHDLKDTSLAQALQAGGVQLLLNKAVTVEKNGARLMIAGVGMSGDDAAPDNYDPYALAAQVPAQACCVLLSHTPDALPQMFTIDSDGGAWIDLALCGHTHGGQVRFGNWVPLNKSAYGLRYLTGWAEHVSGWSLTSNGVGATALPIRFGAPAQAHIITLHRSIPVE